MKLLAKIELFLFIAALFPLFFFLSSNAYYYDYANTAIAIGTIILLNIICLFGLKQLFRYKRKRYELAVVICGLLQAFFYFYNIQHSIIDNDYIYLGIVLTISFIIILAHKFNHMLKINVILTILFSIYFVKFDIALFKDLVLYPAFNEKKLSSDVEFKDFVFKKKPNIYFFHLESYVGKEALKKLYNYDNSGFYKQLNDNGFKVYNNNYSNYLSTYMSLFGVFEMKHHHYIIKYGNADLARTYKKTLGGVKYNTVFNVLKRNGYKTSYFWKTIAFIKAEGADNTNINISKFKLLNELFKIKKLQTSSKKKWGYMPQSYYDNLATFITTVNAKAQPNFFVIELADTNHTSPDRKYVDFKKEYIEHLKVENDKMMELIENILKMDKEAIIILMGDHGAYSYNERVYNNPKEKLNLDIQQEALDKSNALLAIRYPYDKKSNPDVISGVNVFRYIFYELAGRDDYDANKREDITINYGGKIIVKDGKILPDREQDTYFTRKQIKFLGFKIKYKIIKID